MLKINKNKSDSMHICIRAQNLNFQNIYFMDFADIYQLRLFGKCSCNFFM